MKRLIFMLLTVLSFSTAFAANLSETPRWEGGIYRIELNDPVEGGENGIDNRQAKQLGNRTQYLKAEQDKLKITSRTQSSNLVQLQTVDQNTSALIQQLTNRIAALETKPVPVIEAVKVGQIIEFDRHFNTPQEVAAHMGYGTWTRALQGRVSVGFSDRPADPQTVRTSGAQYGEYTHKLTIAEMPKHKHAINVRHENDQNSSIDQNGHFAVDGFGGGVVKHQASQTDGSEMKADGTGNSLFSEGGSNPHNIVQPSRTVDKWKRTN